MKALTKTMFNQLNVNRFQENKSHGTPKSTMICEFKTCVKNLHNSSAYKGQGMLFFPNS